MWIKIQNSLKRHPDVVQAVAAIVQTLIALVMMVALIQSCQQMRLAERALVLSQQQFESTVAPVVSVRNGGETITFENRGAIPVSNVEVAGILVAGFVHDGTNYAMKFSFMDVSTHAIHEGALRNGEKATFSVAPVLKQNIAAFRSEEFYKGLDGEALGIILRYRRKADMAPFHRLLVTRLLKDQNGKERLLPFETEHASVAGGGVGNSAWSFNPKPDLQKKLKELGHQYE